MKKLNALIGSGQTQPKIVLSGINVNGLPIEFVSQWTEYWTKQSFAISVPAIIRRQYYPDDSAFSVAMHKAGYVPVRTRKLTGKKESFWLYRVTGNDKGVCPAVPSSSKACSPFVQVSHRPRYGYNEVALDGKLLHVYGDHIRLLTKKRVRVNGKQVQGYTAKGLRVEVVA
ncbi:hypothetical protein WFK62_14700 [Yersinia enterocolitica]|uniref:hypothetical protein n=1 Tax=Yersinia TaxID=629 RepID=UPI0005E9CA84|nr:MULTISPECIES: hypothetical protein [Yersinia]EKN3384980.1 hypothetical protein [Yersinia enterocolitica]EKN3585979.1 hypothetical protein [Yersinia enterocolitica]EKN3637436.1 hypothetical protein [Yersinia enterocolitica]EKN3768158.1 hypothetical protein [Yersinia enterocolitica]EKN3971647.1 hypothetical protein [Yersinia enterocolitica]